MSTIEIKRVTNRKELRKFVQFHYDLYRNCPRSVPFLYSDELKEKREKSAKTTFKKKYNKRKDLKDQE